MQAWVVQRLSKQVGWVFCMWATQESTQHVSGSNKFECRRSMLYSCNTHSIFNLEHLLNDAGGILGDHNIS